MGEVCDLGEQQWNDILGLTEVQSPISIRVDGVEYGRVLGIVGRQGILQLLGILVKVEVYATVVSSSLVDEDVVEVVPQPLYANDSKRWDFMVYDVLPAYLAFNHIGSDDINYVVSEIK